MLDKILHTYILSDLLILFKFLEASEYSISIVFPVFNTKGF